MSRAVVRWLLNAMSKDWLVCTEEGRERASWIVRLILQIETQVVARI